MTAVADFFLNLDFLIPVLNPNKSTMGRSPLHRAAIMSVAILISLTASFCSAPLTFANSHSTVRTTSMCPFCSAIALTFSEQMNSSDIVVVAKLIEIPPPVEGPDADFPKATFEIVNPLKGEKFVGKGLKFKTQLVGSYPLGQKFLVMGVDPPSIAWTTPMKASDRVFGYLELVQKLPEGGPDRLVFFQDYFEDKESVLAFDAYDEFARAPYEDLIGMKDRMHHDKLIGWIKDTDTSVNRKRLYFTMLGVCGTKDDVPLLEELITSGSRKKRAGLDALIACYLMLKGEAGVDLIEKAFLVDKEVDYVDTLAAVSALRFHGTEADVISKKRIVKAIRHLLDRPKMADMIIPDLARWEDWSVMERLVKMFKEADPESNWLRVPVITYLRACPKPEAKTYIDELQKIDPEAVQRADFFLGFDEDEDWGDEEDDDEESDDSGDTTKSKVDKSDTGNGDVESESDGADSADSFEPAASSCTSNSEEPADESANLEPSVAVPADPPVNVIVKKVPLDTEQEGTVATVANSEAPDSSVAETTTLNPAPSLTPADSNAASAVVSSNPDVGESASNQPASVEQATPIASSTPSYGLTWFIIFVPMGISAVIFLLLWSVVNGWFERLIF